MNRKAKICLIGATAVGKSSVASRYVSSIFSETYRTTIGVKIETRVVRRGDQVVELVIWDLSGEDEFQNVQPSYLRGASGYLLVVDGTRRETIDVARTLAERVRGVVGRAPFVVVLNKADLVASWEITDHDIAVLRRLGGPLLKASAKTGVGVDEAFEQLVDAILRVDVGGTDRWHT
jgi:small GTP-binding protein